VARIEFHKKEDQAWLLDPRDGFTRKAIPFEVRKDPLNGHVSRILPFRRRQAEVRVPEEIVEASRKGCPFCPDQVTSSTPQFIPEIASEGRIRRGKAVVFPNSFPYARHNWVVVISESHFLHLDQFNVDILRDAFLAGQDGISRACKSFPDLRYSSVNWNYLPQAGGGLFHPHLQVVVDEVPTLSQGRDLEALKGYQSQNDSFFWEDFLEEEKRRGERYLGHHGNVHFMVSYSPRGVYGEVTVLFSGRSTILDITPADWEHLGHGLTTLFEYLNGKGLMSFNLSLFSGAMDCLGSWVYGRLCPRILIPPWNTSDINYFEKLHEEVICVVSPEEITKELKPFFSG